MSKKLIILSFSTIVFFITLACSEPTSIKGIGLPMPIVYSGSVTINGSPAPDGLELFATISDYKSENIIIIGGQYAGLAVGPPDKSYTGDKITFHLVNLPSQKASQIDNSINPPSPIFKSNFNLDFSDSANTGKGITCGFPKTESDYNIDITFLLTPLGLLFLSRRKLMK